MHRTTKHENVKFEKNLIFLKKGKTVNCCYSTSENFGKFIHLG